MGLLNALGRFFLQLRGVAAQKVQCILQGLSGLFYGINSRGTCILEAIADTISRFGSGIGRLINSFREPGFDGIIHGVLQCLSD